MVGGRREALALKTAAFRDWLIGGYLKACRRVPSDWAIRRALAALEATARFEGDTPSIFVRVGHDGSGSGSPCYVDLADPGGQAIRIGPEGWTVVDNPCVHFRRRQAYLPLPTPSREGSIELLRPYVNLNDRDFRLLIVWMAAALRPVGPYPVLAIYGDQGSTKTTLAKVIRMLIDPHARSLRAQPRSTRSLMAAAVNVWLLAYDNLGVLPDWLSDGLCLLSTGGTFDGKTSLANDEGSVIHVQRPVILNGMEEFVARGDLADRSVFLHLPPIATTKRRCEIEFWAAFQRGLSTDPGRPVRRGRRRHARAALGPAHGVAPYGRLRRIRRGGRSKPRVARRYSDLRLQRQSSRSEHVAARRFAAGGFPARPRPRLLEQLVGIPFAALQRPHLACGQHRGIAPLAQVAGSAHRRAPPHRPAARRPWHTRSFQAKP